MHVVGTAGHVDHGKSTLVHALTGIDPDRLREEKERGLTIDLGFAWLTLPSGREVSIVDVPGHERFIKNMLAGVGGIDLALLVVAADESVMPQTREHLAILDLLKVKRGIAVITKRDLVDEDILGLAQLEVEELLDNTTLAGSPLLPVSATTGEGLPELLEAIDRALDETKPRKDVGRPRLAVDRAFSISGFGTVVTGTLIDGSLRLGQEVLLTRRGKPGRIRGLQTHREKLEEARPGTRVAVNLSGVSTDDVERGEVLTSPGWLHSTRAFDARVYLLADVPRGMRHNLPVTFHAHTTETAARVRLLDRDVLEPGDEAWAQVWLEEPAPLVRGDRFVLRSSDATLGGGTVVDVDAKRHRRRHAATLTRLETLAEGSPTAQLVSALEAGEPANVATLARRTNASVADTTELARQAIAEGAAVVLGQEVTDASLLYTAKGWAGQSGRAQQTLAAFHAQYPLRQGISRQELRSRLGLTGATAQVVLTHLAASGTIVDDDAGTVRLLDHEVAVSAEQQAAMNTYVAQLTKDPFPVTAPSIAADLLVLLAEQGRVVRATDGVVLEAASYREIEGRIVDHMRAAGKATLADVRDLLGTSRKYAQALLEHLDEEKITRRVGDERVLLRG